MSQDLVLSAMRPAWVLAMLAAAALPGCNDGEPPPFQPTCPYWTASPNGTVVHGMFHRNDTARNERQDNLGLGALERDDRPLDRVELNFGPYASPGGEPKQQGISLRDGRLRVSFERADNGSPLAAYKPGSADEAKAEWTWESGTHRDFALAIDLSAPDVPLDSLTPSSVIVRWTFQRNLDGNPATASDAQILYNAKFLYRMC